MGTRQFFLLLVQIDTKWTSQLSVLVRFRVLWKSLPDLVLHYNYASMARETLMCTVVNGTHESGDNEGSIYS
ncbi:hypothetical protein F4703DRAFT_1840045 [Phycomyces blakesleeanus]